MIGLKNGAEPPKTGETEGAGGAAERRLGSKTAKTEVEPQSRIGILGRG